MVGNAIPWRLRPITVADEQWAFALHEQSLGEYVAAIWGWDGEFQRGLFSATFAQRAREVIEVAGEAVGILEVDDRPEELYLAGIELAPPWQRRGLGAEILHRLLARAARSDKPLTLHVLESNSRARAFYEREGLHVVASEPPKLRMSTGTA